MGNTTPNSFPASVTTSKPILMDDFSAFPQVSPAAPKSLENQVAVTQPKPSEISNFGAFPQLPSGTQEEFSDFQPFTSASPSNNTQALVFPISSPKSDTLSNTSQPAEVVSKPSTQELFADFQAFSSASPPQSETANVSLPKQDIRGPTEPELKPADPKPIEAKRVEPEHTQPSRGNADLFEHLIAVAPVQLKTSPAVPVSLPPPKVIVPAAPPQPTGPSAAEEASRILNSIPDQSFFAEGT